MKRRIVAVILALVLAIAGAGLVISYVRGADDRAVDAQHPVTAYVAKQLIPAGTSLATAQSEGLITATKVAKSGRPDGVLTSVNTANSDLVATTDIQPGEFVMSARFGTSPVTDRAISVPSDKVAISVQLTAPERVANFITPGSHIVIYATHGLKSLGTTDEAKAFNELNFTGTNVLLPDVEVIAFGDTPLNAPRNDASASEAADKTGTDTNSNADAGKGDAAYLVTVAVTPNDSVRLVHAINGYTLYAGLLGSDTKVNPKGEADDGDVFGGKSLMDGNSSAGSK